MILHALHEQDSRRLGGTIRQNTIVYEGFLVGSTALVGFPFLSGFYSKDSLIELALSDRNAWGH